MISLTRLAEELTGAITRRTGVFASAQRLHTAVYPLYALRLMPEESIPAAGGDQLLRTVSVTVDCYGSRQRQATEGMDLADRLVMALALGVSLEDRHLTPTRITCRMVENRPEVSFRLVFYDLAEGVTE